MADDPGAILFISPSLATGGSERVLSYILDHFSFLGRRVSLVIFKDQKDYLSSLRFFSGPVHCFFKTSRWDSFFIPFKLLAHIRKTKPHTVVSFLEYTNILVAFSVLGLAKKPRIVMAERNYNPANLKVVRWGWLKRLLLKWAYTYADIVIGNSKLIEQSLTKDFGVSASKTRVVYNPIPLEKVRKAMSAPLEVPAETQGKTLVLCAGRLSVQKRFDLAIKAMARLKDDVHLVILGKGVLQLELQTLASNLSVAGRVHFVGYQKNPYAWMARCHVFALTSDFEGFPNVLLEAMACGLPIVSTDCPSGPSEIITDGTDGYLVPVGDEAALAARLAQLAGDLELRRKLAAAASETVKRFSIEKIMPQFEEVL